MNYNLIENVRDFGKEKSDYLCEFGHFEKALKNINVRNATWNEDLSKINGNWQWNGCKFEIEVYFCWSLVLFNTGIDHLVVWNDSRQEKLCADEMSWVFSLLKEEKTLWSLMKEIDWHFNNKCTKRVYKVKYNSDGNITQWIAKV